MLGNRTEKNVHRAGKYLAGTSYGSPRGLLARLVRVRVRLANPTGKPVGYINFAYLSPYCGTRSRYRTTVRVRDLRGGTTYPPPPYATVQLHLW